MRRLVALVVFCYCYDNEQHPQSMASRYSGWISMTMQVISSFRLRPSRRRKFASAGPPNDGTEDPPGEHSALFRQEAHSNKQCR